MLGLIQQHSESRKRQWIKALAKTEKFQSDMVENKVQTILRTRKALSSQKEKDNTWSPSLSKFVSWVGTDTPKCRSAECILRSWFRVGNFVDNAFLQPQTNHLSLVCNLFVKRSILGTITLHRCIYKFPHIFIKSGLEIQYFYF